MTMTPEQFVSKWRGTSLRERQSYQLHFRDLCKMLGHAEPDGSGLDKDGKIFQFERALKKTSGGQGFADVYYEGHFAIEYKAPGKYKDLSEAYHQLLQYRENLNNPPLLVVTDINHWEIHSNFPNTQKRAYRIQHSEIAGNPQKREWLRDMFFAPERLHPRRNTEEVTRDAAQAFQLIADNMRQWEAETERIAYFLTKLVFCLFAEDIGLLPTAADSPQGIFSYVIEQARRRPSVFPKYVQDLFRAMAVGDDFLMRDIPYFNGALFRVLTVEDLQQEALEELAKAAALNWAAIEPSIFGTLFERSLDPAKRSQLGAHYTSRDDIRLIVEPVLMQPLRYHWDTVQLQAEPIRARLDRARTGRDRNAAANQLTALRDEMLARLRGCTVLDPACGSGNFLYVSLQLLMDLEKEVIQHPLWEGLQMPLPAVHPRQMYGIEINPIAHALASIVVWIGYIQWRSNNGYHSHFSEPILEELQGNIVCKDAILPAEDENADWTPVDVIVGNPPFLGGQKMLRELGDDYVVRLRAAYPHLHSSSDLVTYWFENARQHIKNGNAKRAGLLATQTIRGGFNQSVLERIKESGDIFMAWSNREWVLDGAAVGVAMIGFDNGNESRKVLDGIPVTNINSDLSSITDISLAKPLAENQGLSFEGCKKSGNFQIDSNLAAQLLRADPINKEVVKLWINGNDVAKSFRNMWIIDFGDMPLVDASKYELPFKFVETNVKKDRLKNKEKRQRELWWQFARPRPEMRAALIGLNRFIATTRVAKYRNFVFVDSNVVPDSRLFVITRDDNYFFGVLNSKIHEVWALRRAPMHGGNTPTYNNTICFETFPFPWAPGSEPAAHPARIRVSAAAKQLHQERDAWLNPAPSDEPAKGDKSPSLILGNIPREAGDRGGARFRVGAKSLKDRTLTNLYNALAVFRGKDAMRVKAVAADFAPRLDELHRTLDEAVCDAYGWDCALLDDEEEILRRLLALNLQRAGS